MACDLTSTSIKCVVCETTVLRFLERFVADALFFGMIFIVLILTFGKRVFVSHETVIVSDHFVVYEAVKFCTMSLSQLSGHRIFFGVAYEVSFFKCHVCLIVSTYLIL